MEEIWKAIDGFDGRFYISNKGRIKSLYHYHGKSAYKGIRITYRKQTLDKDGYYFINLKINGKTSTKKTHRLVANAFIRQLVPGDHVCHIDGNEKNNNVHNLYIGTPKTNTLDKVRLGTTAVSIKDIYEIKRLALIKSNLEIAKIYNITPSFVSKIILGKSYYYV